MARVMGSKNLKAIAVRGTGGRARGPARGVLDLCLHASREGQSRTLPGGAWRGVPARLRRPNYRTRKCGFCATPCAASPLL